MSPTSVLVHFFIINMGVGLIWSTALNSQGHLAAKWMSRKLVCSMLGFHISLKSCEWFLIHWRFILTPVSCACSVSRSNEVKQICCSRDIRTQQTHGVARSRLPSLVQLSVRKPQLASVYLRIAGGTRVPNQHYLNLCFRYNILAPVCCRGSTWSRLKRIRFSDRLGNSSHCFEGLWHIGATQTSCQGKTRNAHM